MNTVDERLTELAEGIYCRECRLINAAHIVCRVCETVEHLPVPSFERYTQLLQVCCCGPSSQEISIDCCTAGAQQPHIVSCHRKLNLFLFGLVCPWAAEAVMAYYM